MSIIEINKQTNKQTYPDHAVGAARHDDVVGVPLVDLTEAQTEDLLHAVRGAHRCVHPGYLCSVHRPHVQPRARGGGDVTLKGGGATGGG